MHYNGIPGLLILEIVAYCKMVKFNSFLCTVGFKFAAGGLLLSCHFENNIWSLCYRWVQNERLELFNIVFDVCLFVWI